jgi:Ca2+-binding EF-hand superfamily protein
MFDKAKSDFHRDLQALDWDSFMTFIERYRELEREEFRRRAGFSEEEVEKYLEQFNKYDRDKSGDVSVKELMPLLTVLGHAPKNVMQRDKLNALLREMDEDGSGEISFEEFLQLMRRFLDEADIEAQKKERDVVERVGFSTEEVAMWRQIFLKFDQDDSGEYDMDETRILLRAVGVQMNYRQEQEMFKRLFNDCDADSSGSLDFPEFCLLMKKMVDVDFGGIASKLKPPPPKKRKTRMTRFVDPDGEHGLGLPPGGVQPA